jgi:hypothetical protein
VSGAREHFDFVDEHRNKKGRGSEPRPGKWMNDQFPAWAGSGRT